MVLKLLDTCMPSCVSVPSGILLPKFVHGKVIGKSNSTIVYEEQLSAVAYLRIELREDLNNLE